MNAYSHKPKDLADYQLEMEILIKKWLHNYQVIKTIQIFLQKCPLLSVLSVPSSTSPVNNSCKIAVFKAIASWAFAGKHDSSQVACCHSGCRKLKPKRNPNGHMQSTL